MKTATLAFAAAALVGGAALGQEDDSSKKIQDLIRQLGSDDFQTRESATQELKKLGKAAEPALREALSHEDAEVRARARQALDEIEKAQAPKPEPPRRRLSIPGFPGAPGAPGFGFRGSSIQVQSVNGDTTYKITPGDGSDPITFHKSAAGGVKLEYPGEKGEKKTAEAESLGKFLKDHKELAEKYGISEEGIDYGGARSSFKGGGVPGFAIPRGAWRFRALPPKDEDDLNDLLDSVLKLEPGQKAAGATLERVPDALRAQFELPEGEGLVVSRVAGGSDAEAAGLRLHDVLLEIDGKKVTSARDVRENLKKAGSVTVLRKGKRETLKPEKKDY